MVKSACIGFCRSSDNKKLGETVDDYINGKISEQELQNYCKNVRLENIKTQRDIGIDIITSNDFAMYDHMLDATCFVGNIQRRYYWEGGKIPLEIYFSLANGMQKDKFDVSPLKLQNWMNTNYLYHVPEFISPIEFSYSDNKPVVEYLDAKHAGIETRPTIIAPITYLLQGKSFEHDVEPIDLIDEILPVYQDLFSNFQIIGVRSVQIEDPMVCFAIDREMKDTYMYCYEKLKQYAKGIELNFITYYCSLRENFNFIFSLPVDSIHIDIPYNINYIDEYVDFTPKGSKVSLGVVDSRNVWKNNLDNSIEIVSKFCDKVGSDNVVVANSSPLFLCPYSTKLEYNLPDNLKKQLSFGVEKMQEVEIIKTAINKGSKAVDSQLKENRKIFSKNDKIYTGCFYENEANVKSEKYKSKWHDFVKKHNMRMNPIMFSGNTDLSIQNETMVDVVSVGACSGKESYDISCYEDFVKGMVVLENNFIPRFGSNYYKPIIISEDLKIKGDVFKSGIKNAKKGIKKPLKFNVCSPLHFMNFSFISPFIDQKNVYNKFSSDLSCCLRDILSDIDILQINDFTFLANRKLNRLDNFGDVDYYCKCLNQFIDSIKCTKCIALFNSFGNMDASSSYLEAICSAKVDIILLSSVRSGHDVIDTFTKYKPEIPIGFGMIDLYSNRISTKNEMFLAIKKIFMAMERENVLFTTEGDLRNNEKKTVDGVVKSLNSFEAGMKEVKKEIDKKNKKSS